MEQSNHGGYWVKYRGDVRAWCPTKEKAEEMIDEKSGAAYKRLPEVRHADLEVIDGNKITERPGCWYRHTVYKYKGAEIGRVQTKCDRGRTQITTHSGNACVMGANLKWLCEQAKLRLVS